MTRTLTVCIILLGKLRLDQLPCRNMDDAPRQVEQRPNSAIVGHDPRLPSRQDAEMCGIPFKVIVVPSERLSIVPVAVETWLCSNCRRLIP